MYIRKINYLLIFIIFTTLVFSQPVKLKNSSEILLAMQKLKVLGSVLYIAAHPDDENTGLMAYLSKEEKYRTAYLSLTRGDGGQNLIGSEKGSQIGIIRSQELLEARKIDGGEQYFTRAIDFGYSKSSDESFNIWGRNEVLSDIVWIIRKYKPDIIITRFSLEDGGGHGHHSAATILTLEAFRATGDKTKFAEQLKYVEPWQAKRLFWNKWRPQPEEIKELASVDLGSYNYLLGKSYNEIAAESRTMHKSQGFGSTANRGTQIDYFQLMDGEPAGKNIFLGVNTSWSRIPNGENIQNQIDKIISEFDYLNPSKSVKPLALLYQQIATLENDCWVQLKKQELAAIIQSCAGLWVEAIANDYSAAPGQSIDITTTILNRSSEAFLIENIEFKTIGKLEKVDKLADRNILSRTKSSIVLPENYKISQPYWLEEEPSSGLFKVNEQNLIGPAQNSAAIPVTVNFKYEDVKIQLETSVLYRWTDRVDGEKFRPFEIRPLVTANFINKVAVFANGNEKEIQVKIKSGANNVKGFLELEGHGFWQITPEKIEFTLEKKYDEKIISFKVKPLKKSEVFDLKAKATIDNKIYTKSLVEISHPHIENQIHFPESSIKLVRLGLKQLKGKIGYIDGSGDEIPQSLIDLGYEVVFLTDEMLTENNLKQFDAIVAGVRAYNTRERLKFVSSNLIEYVNNGGTYIVQYNVNTGLVTDKIGPYPFKIGRERITVEEAELKMLNKEHQLFNYPNKIEANDFNNWVQERGLYFASEWDKNYSTVVAGNDPNEKVLEGGTIFTRYGKGVFIYSGIAWFRQLPAGVPGAYKLFINMIEAGKFNEKK